MGLGKTIQALALITTRRSENPAIKTTLIVAPVALLRQWELEIAQRVHPRHKLSCFVFHGQLPKITFASLSQWDVVLTSYGKLAAEYTRKIGFELRKKSNPGAQIRPSEKLILLDERSRWYRVILDESQNIKGSNTKSALGTLYLNATFRLCMTGTPMMNNVGELFSPVRFLRIPPYNSLQDFNRTFKKPLESRHLETRNRAMTQLQVFLKSIMLRRTKSSEIDGKPILNLPERTTETNHAVFDEDQEGFYRALELQTQIQMNKFLEEGKALKNYSYILVRLLRLRQACDHPHLIKDYAEEAYAEMSPEEMETLARSLAPDVVQRIKDAKGSFECPICYDGVENPSIFYPCGHDCCPECFARITDHSINENQAGAKCPECRTPLDTKRIIDYRSFRKVHLPHEIEDDGMDGILPKAVEDEEEDDSDSDSDDSDDDSDDVDSQGDLRDFVVNDDEEQEEGNDDEAEDGNEEDDNLPVDSVDNEAETSGDVKAEGGSGSESKAMVNRKKGKKKRSKKKRNSNGKGKGKEKKNLRMNLVELRKEGMKNATAKRKYLKRLRKQFITSAKIEKTMELLEGIEENDPAEKVIVFSQFTTFLDLMEVRISETKWRYRRYDGGMNAKQRNDAVLDFQDREKNIKLMLVSLKAGNAGLNLTAASQVIILDPFWNPFIEEQAIDRAHRIGQQRPVHVHRILVENTVEDRIIALQDKKREIIESALDESTSKNLSRLGRRELRYLFGLDSAPPPM